MGNGIRPLTGDEVNQVIHHYQQPVANYNKIGRLTHEGKWNRYVCGLLTLNNTPRLTHLTKVLNHSFAQLEQKGVKLFDPANQNLDYRKQAEAYRSRFQSYFKLAEMVEQKIENLQKVNPLLKTEYQKLKVQEVGLRYSLESSNGGLDPLPEPDSMCLDQLMRYTQEWKKREKLIINKNLNPLEIDQLKQAARYPAWVALLRNNPDFIKEFMGWSIRDYNPVDVFIKYPQTQKKIKAALLASSLGYSRDLNNETLAIRKVATKVEGVFKKQLTLPVYHGDYREFNLAKQTRVNILKPSQEIYFEQGQYRLTMKELFKQSAQKKLKEVNINLCANWGLINYHPVHGPWHADSQSYQTPPYQTLTKEEWINQVPPARITSQEELERQYGEEAKGKTIFYAAMGTRQRLDLHALDCHGFWQFYVAMGNGKWKVLNMGVYAYRFQRGLLDGLVMFCDTVARVLCLIDQNGSYTHRQRAAYPIFPSPEESQQVLDRIFKIMTKSGVFQFAGRNCAYSVQKSGEKCIQNLPNLFRMPVSKIKSGFKLLDHVLAWADSKAEWLRWWIITFIHKMIFQSSRKMLITKPQEKEGRMVETEVWYSVNEHLGQKHETTNPAYLAEQITQAKRSGTGSFVKGKLYWGNTEERVEGLVASPLLNPVSPA